MSKASAERPSKAQQNCSGTDSANPEGRGPATNGGAARMTPADGPLAGWTLPNRTVAFVGESGVVATRAVSLRGPVCAPGFSVGVFIGNMPGLGDAGRGPDGGGWAGGLGPASDSGAFTSVGEEEDGGLTPAGRGEIFGGRIAPGGTGASGRRMGGAGG
ncbi:MAG TPA: hypothetical protein VNW28_08575 [Chthoniobacterales bacterium]|jgi:hypothetical protein|nr:hypothetical protein [Chthoniobacterales bacterium]